MASTDTLIMKNPMMFGEGNGSDATPLGNGKTGVLVKGAIGEEEILFNRYDLWHWGEHGELPRLEGMLEKARALIESGKYLEGNNLMYDELVKAGYRSEPGVPLPLGSMKIHFATESLFSGYRRKLHMDRGECEILYTQGSRHVVRRCFVSRKDDTFYYEYSADEDTDFTLDFGFYDDKTKYTQRTLEELGSGMTRMVEDEGFLYTVKAAGQEFGAAVRIFGVKPRIEGEKLAFSGRYFRIAVKCVSGRRSLSRLASPQDFDYEKKLAEHRRLHGRLYHSADLKLTRQGSHSNEELLAEAYDTCGSPELIEKMWKFGRYLFVSGTCRDGLPFPLYGLWHTGYNSQWAQHVANENVEIIYWHANVGSLASLVRPLIHYYYSHMAEFAETAEKVYGCRGIFVGGYTTPANAHLNVFVPVILHFTGVAGWLSQHFYKYYRMTGDEKTLREEILPFMLAAADFYLDFITYDREGKVQLCPSVSPENTPDNLMTSDKRHMAHPNPAVKNAAIEIAIVKELFGNLLELIGEMGEHREYEAPLKAVLERMPEYRINKDGALKEWLNEEFEDRYAHRHVSHIYPLFPGEEISREGEPALYQALERAVDLRELGAQSGWSLAHTASIYATMKRPEKVMESLDTLLKGCTLPNFFTLHNDYRDMGVTLVWTPYPVQLDANMGFVNAVQKMILDERCGVVELLPSLPERLNQGRVKGFSFTTGKVDMEWNREKGIFRAKIRLTRAGETRIRLPEFAGSVQVETEGAKWALEGREIGLMASDIGLTASYIRLTASDIVP